MSIEQFFRSRMVSVLGARPPPGLPDLVSRLLEYRLVRGILPQDEVFDDAEEPLTLLLLCLLSREKIRAARRVIHHLRKDHRPRRRQWPPRPPQMQRARVPMPNRLLPCASLVDRLQREGNFDELFLLDSGHGISLNSLRLMGMPLQ